MKQLEKHLFVEDKLNPSFDSQGQNVCFIGFVAIEKQ